MAFLGIDNNEDFTGLEEAEVSRQIAEKVYEEKFNQLTSRLEKQESLSMNVIVGSIVALFFVLAGLIWGAWTFIGEYNQHYLEAEKDFSDKIDLLRKDNQEFRDDILNELSKKTTVK